MHRKSRISNRQPPPAAFTRERHARVIRNTIEGEIVGDFQITAGYFLGSLFWSFSIGIGRFFTNHSKKIGSTLDACRRCCL
jgi:hypothetical protein